MRYRLKLEYDVVPLVGLPKYGNRVELLDGWVRFLNFWSGDKKFPVYGKVQLDPNQEYFVVRNTLTDRVSVLTKAELEAKYEVIE